jgi:hypothetical protein
MVGGGLGQILVKDADLGIGHEKVLLRLTFKCSTVCLTQG